MKRRTIGIAALASAVVVAVGVTATWTAVSKTTNADAGRLTLQLRLDSSTADAGTQLRGFAILSNGTDRSIPWYTCPRGAVLVGLTRPGIAFNPAIATDACFSKTVLRPRSSLRIAVSIWTGYQGCGGPSQPVPVCPHDGIPLLPLGSYSVKVLNWGLPPHTAVLATPKVTLVNATTGRSSGPTGGSIAIQAYGCESIADQPPLPVVVTRGARVLASRKSLGAGQEMTIGASPGTYLVHSGSHPDVAVHVVNGVQAIAVIEPHCSV